MTPRSLAQVLEASARLWPERPAIVDPAGWSLTYAELDRYANAVARCLAAKGVKRGDRVGVGSSPRAGTAERDRVFTARSVPSLLPASPLLLSSSCGSSALRLALCSVSAHGDAQGPQGWYSNAPASARVPGLPTSSMSTRSSPSKSVIGARVSSATSMQGELLVIRKLREAASTNTGV